MYGFGDGNLAAGRMRVALFGTIERVEGDKELAKCKEAYLEGQSGRQFSTKWAEKQSDADLSWLFDT